MLAATTHSNQHLLPLSLLALLTLGLLAACGGDDDDADEAPESLLFVQNAVSGELTASGDGYTLTLEGVAEDTVWFTGRPARRAGTEPTAELLDVIFLGNESPPNAAAG